MPKKSPKKQIKRTRRRRRSSISRPRMVGGNGDFEEYVDSRPHYNNFEEMLQGGIENFRQMKLHPALYR